MTIADNISIFYMMLLLESEKSNSQGDSIIIWQINSEPGFFLKKIFRNSTKVHSFTLSNREKYKKFSKCCINTKSFFSCIALLMVVVGG